MASLVDIILFYSIAYVTLFVSVFWLTTFFFSEKRRYKSVSAYPSLSIIVPAYNEEKSIKKCIESLQKQRYPGLKMIVVDDGSTDGTGNIVKSLKYRNLAYIRKENGGKASALNLGLRQVDTELFGFIDSDTHLSRNALKNMVAYFSGNVASVTAAIKPVRSVNFIEKLQRIEYTISSFTRRLLSLIDSLYYTPAFALYKTAIVKKLGGFDEGNITEDLEIGLKLKNKGYMIENSLDAKAYTITPKSFRGLMRQRIRWYRGYMYNSRKYSHMFFNRKFGDLGVLVLPLQYILLALVIPFMFIMVYNTTVFLSKTFIDLSITGFDMQYLAGTYKFSLISPTTFFSIAFVATFFIMLKLSSLKLRDKIRNMDYVVYMVAYPFINLALWLIAIAHEIARKERRW